MMDGQRKSNAKGRGRSCENRSLSDLLVVSLSVDVEQAREKFEEPEI